MRSRQIGSSPQIFGVNIPKIMLKCHHRVLPLHQKHWIQTETKHVPSVTQVVFVHNFFWQRCFMFKDLRLLFFQKPIRPRQLQVIQVVLGEICNALRILTSPVETPDPPNDTPGALEQVVLTPHDIPWSLRVYFKRTNHRFKPAKHRRILGLIHKK